VLEAMSICGTSGELELAGNREGAAPPRPCGKLPQRYDICSQSVSAHSLRWESPFCAIRRSHTETTILRPPEKSPTVFRSLSLEFA